VTGRRRRLSAVVLVVAACLVVGGSLAVTSVRDVGSASGHQGQEASASVDQSRRPDRPGSTSSSTTTTTTTSPATAPTLAAARSTPSAPPLGLYAGPGAATAVVAADDQLGHRVADAFDFLPYTTWAALTDPSWLAAGWQGASFGQILGIPMLPATGATLAAGAQGTYDAEFATLARALVAEGWGTATLVIGWQPDDPGTPWSVGSAAAAAQYVAYWDDIATTMAATPGARFGFEWDAGDTKTAVVTPVQTYPGDAAVDVVATDGFDNGYTSLPATEQWTALLEQPYGPAWMAQFAAAHHKPMALAMWGPVPKSVGGGGDNPTFAVDLLRWAAASHLASCVLWDYGQWAALGGGFPATAAAIDRWFGGTSGAGTP